MNWCIQQNAVQIACLPVVSIQQVFEITGFAAVVEVLPIWRENSKKKFYQKKHTCVSLQGKQAVLMPWVSLKSSFLKRVVHVMVLDGVG